MWDFKYNRPCYDLTKCKRLVATLQATPAS